ncbi:hypothetical protein TNCV_2527211 [Trichonephila clavipes]|nr:hypothetical protein TNCV_2527211 [Trichonephila clavipes]
MVTSSWLAFLTSRLEAQLHGYKLLAGVVDFLDFMVTNSWPVVNFRLEAGVHGYKLVAGICRLPEACTWLKLAGVVNLGQKLNMVTNSWLAFVDFQWLWLSTTRLEAECTWLQTRGWHLSTSRLEAECTWLQTRGWRLSTLSVHGYKLVAVAVD